MGIIVDKVGLQLFFEPLQLEILYLQQPFKWRLNMTSFGSLASLLHIYKLQRSFVGRLANV